MLPAAKVRRHAGGMLMRGSKALRGSKAWPFRLHIVLESGSGGGIFSHGPNHTVPCPFAECHDAPACRRFHVGPAGCSMFADAKGVSRRVAAGGGRAGGGAWQAGSKLA